MQLRCIIIDFVQEETNTNYAYFFFGKLLKCWLNSPAGVEPCIFLEIKTMKIGLLQ